MESSFSIVLFILGVILIVVSISFIWKSKIKFMELEHKLDQKEKTLYDLYESIEILLQEIKQTYNQNTENNYNNLSFNTDNVVDSNIHNNSIDKTSMSDQSDNIDSNEIQTNIDTQNKKPEIIMLRQQGLSEDDIAKKLKIGIGEVRLILGLNSFANQNSQVNIAKKL